MKIRSFLMMLLVLGIFATRCVALTCDICNQPIHGKYYRKKDQATGAEMNICTNCTQLPDLCFICNIPVAAGGTTLPDGRVLCPRDSVLAIHSDTEAKEICDGVKEDLNRLLVRYMEYPGTNVLISMVNRFYLENLFMKPGEGQACVSVYGATTSNHLPGNKLLHSVAILSDLRREKLMAVCAHELTHTWINENVSHDRRIALDKDMVEGFCELVSYKYMQSRNQTNEMEVIRVNDYTKGKILVLIAADEKYGFGSVMDWLKQGDDRALSLTALERVRAINGTYVSPIAASTSWAMPAAAQAVVAPTNLVLKSVSGSGKNRFAMINSTTFETMEKAKVRLGQTNVILRCLEIHDDSVVIQLDGSPEKRTLFLGKN